MREIAEVIGRGLKAPVVNLAHEEALAHCPGNDLDGIQPEPD